MKRGDSALRRCANTASRSVPAHSSRRPPRCATLTANDMSLFTVGIDRSSNSRISFG